jgi:hypothetical protein
LSGFASGLESSGKGNASIAHLPLPSIWFEGADINVKKAWAGLIGHLRICPSGLPVQPQFRCHNQTDPVPGSPTAPVKRRAVIMRGVCCTVCCRLLHDRGSCINRMRDPGDPTRRTTASRCARTMSALGGNPENICSTRAFCILTRTGREHRIRMPAPRTSRRRPHASRRSTLPALRSRSHLLSSASRTFTSRRFCLPC